jgi:hypothetical protein
VFFLFLLTGLQASWRDAWINCELKRFLGQGNSLFYCQAAKAMCSAGRVSLKDSFPEDFPADIKD